VCQSWACNSEQREPSIWQITTIGLDLAKRIFQVRLIPPAYAKAYVWRNKTDPAGAEAICEAVSRPQMRFIPIESKADQAMVAVDRVRERLTAQRTQSINPLRGQMAEFGVVAAKGPQHVKQLVAEPVEPGSVPEPLRQVLWGC
jgi:transposase